MNFKIKRVSNYDPFAVEGRQSRVQYLHEQKWKKDLSRKMHRRIYSEPLLKRVVDVVFSLAAIVCLSPVFVFVAGMIKLEDRGPILFKQTRVGLNGTHFRMLKFRSMRVNADQMKQQLASMNQHEKGVTFKIKNDPRVTNIGRFIRKYSIDELPQLFNVLYGNMTLVGPRPAVPSEVSHYQSFHLARLAAKPGITCIWQVSGRANIDFEGQVSLDKEYIQKQGFLYDFMLLLKTVPAVIFAKGSY